jgi:glutamyl-tRNA reductase
MLDRSFVVGISHKDAPIDVREKLGAICESEVLRSVPLLGEAMVLSTCNRYEVYGFAPTGISVESSLESVQEFLREKAGVCHHGWHGISFVKTGEDMLRHGFNVASSLESMVLGEPQILGQMKNAYNIAKTNGHVSAFMERFCHASFRVGKRVRTETTIAHNAVSVASTAVRLAAEHVDDLKTAKVLLLGAGDMTISALKHLDVLGATDINILNRTPSRAQKLADDFSARMGVAIKSAGMESLSRYLVDADVVITATSSLVPVVTPEVVQGANKLTLIDIAVPRDVSRDVDQMDGVTVLDIDDLGRYVQAAKEARIQQVEKARDIISEEIKSFSQWEDEQKNAHMVRYLREHSEGLRQEVLQKFDSPEAEAATRLLLNKMLHHPMKAIKDGHAPAGSMEHIVALLFGIECPRRVQFLPSDENSSTKQGCPFIAQMAATSKEWKVCPVTHWQHPLQ